jgi:LysM repeat protein
MLDRSLARFLAPLALLAVLIGVIVVVSTSGSDSATPTSVVHATTVSHRAHAKPHPHSYRVRPGDSLSAISARTGVSVDALQRLNPDADPQALHVGERLKLTQ